MFIIITKTNSCPAGQNRTKTKLPNGQWEQVWSYTSGVPVEYPTRDHAERDSNSMDLHYRDFVSVRVEEV